MSVDDPDQASARADLLRFLAACFYEPDPAFSEERLFDSMLAAAGKIDPGLAEAARRLGEAFEAQDLQTLLVDYARLFLGPMTPLARPYGSSWLPVAAAQAEAPCAALLALYHEGGFEIDDSFQDLPDHVAVELEFLYLLSVHEHQARKAGDAGAADAACSLRRRFLGEHLGAWIVPFTAAVRAGAATAFYRELAELTELVVHLEGRQPSSVTQH